MILGKVDFNYSIKIYKYILLLIGDVYSYGMTLIDVMTLTVHEVGSLEKKLELITLRYGLKFKKFVEYILQEDPNLRPDFVELMNSDLYYNLIIEESFCEITQKQLTMLRK